MSDPIRCYTTNEMIGAYRPIYNALRAKMGPEADLTPFLRELGITQYPQIMRMTTHMEPAEARLMTVFPASTAPAKK